MALEIYWYDSICLGVVVFSIFGALYVLRLKEGKINSNSKYESLLVSSAKVEGISNVDDECEKSRGYVAYSCLWRSCWKGLHPAWLLGLRVFALVFLSGFLVWDIRAWGVSIFNYYTEWTLTLVIIYFATNKKDLLLEFEGGDDLLKDDVEQNNTMPSVQSQLH